MKPIDPRESPLYDGPELSGLSSDAKFDLKKQFRIIERNKRLAMKMGDDRVRYQTDFPLWLLTGGVAIIVGGLAITLALLDLSHVLRPH